MVEHDVWVKEGRQGPPIRVKLERRQEGSLIVADLVDGIREKTGCKGIRVYSLAKKHCCETEVVPESPKSAPALYFEHNEAVKPRSPKKSKLSFAVDMLLPPEEVIPYSMNEPKRYVSNVDFENIANEISPYFEEFNEDMDHTVDFNRTPPLALVRCSRGGKTRALTEIAKKLRKTLTACVIYVTLNDWSSMRPEEQGDPLLALCRRIAFVASKDSNATKFQGPKWNAFYESNIHVEPEDIEEWLGDTPAVLIVDELNNLDELLKKGSNAASEFGLFIKCNFLDRPKRYFIFSSHNLGAQEFFSLYVDPSGGSMRAVLLQEIPILQSLEDGMKLKKNLKGPPASQLRSEP